MIQFQKMREQKGFYLIKEFFSSSNRKKLFLDTNFKKGVISNKVDIILSPSFYWFKKEILKVGSVFKAKKLAPSIFFGLLPENRKFEYFVTENKDMKELKKGESEFWFFAYDKDKILKFLDDVEFPKEKIGSFHFAQIEFKNLEEPLKIKSGFMKSEESTRCIINLDGTLNIIPICMVDSHKNINSYLIEMGNLSNKKVSIHSDKNSLDDKNFYTLLVVLVLFTLSYFNDVIFFKNSFDTISSNKEEIYEKYSLPSTSIQLNAIKSKFAKSDKEQKSIRAVLSEVKKLPLLNEEFIKSLRIDNKKVEIQINLKEDKRAEVLKNPIAKFLDLTSLNVKDSLLKIEGKIR